MQTASGTRVATRVNDDSVTRPVDRCDPGRQSPNWLCEGGLYAKDLTRVDDRRGTPAVALQVPVRTFVDYGDNVSPNAQAACKAYAAARDKGKHIVVKPGDKIPIKGLEVLVVTAGGEDIKGGEPNPFCLGFKPNNEYLGRKAG